MAFAIDSISSNICPLVNLSSCKEILLVGVFFRGGGYLLKGILSNGRGWHFLIVPFLNVVWCKLKGEMLPNQFHYLIDT